MSDSVKEVVAWLGVLGIPSMFAMLKWCISVCASLKKQLTILAKAQQAQMRSQLLSQYHFYMAQEWISEEQMKDWENQYQAYHCLGENGILDSRREDLLKLKSTDKWNNESIVEDFKEVN